MLLGLSLAEVGLTAAEFGVLMGAYGLAAPLLCGAGLKVVYDVALYRSFKSVRAPEESGH